MCILFERENWSASYLFIVLYITASVPLISFNVGLEFSGNSSSNGIKSEGIEVTHTRGQNEVDGIFLFNAER